MFTAALCLTACSGIGTGSLQPDAYCSANGYAFHTDFSGAALYACSTGENGPELVIAPEFTPINPSPWYAYRMTAMQPSSNDKAVTITQSYIHGQHRYTPWTRQHGSEWQQVPEELIQVAADRSSFSYRLVVPASGIEVAAQPPLSVAETRQWARQLAADYGLQHHPLLRTRLGLSVDLYDTANTDAEGMILLLGRQHPPELTGAYAYREFVEWLFKDEKLAAAFRDRYRLVLVPVVNPDGVELGHWRMNRGGMDLNRDWGPFTQPETRAIADWLASAHPGTPLILLLDFHSTWNDVLYGQHPADTPIPAGFNQAWYEEIRAELRDDTPAWSGQNNPGLPTAKSWARREYGVSAITYEVGDRTSRVQIEYKAYVSSQALMRVLLALPSNAPGNSKE